MRHEKTAAYLCTGLLLFAITGCGHSDADVDADVITIVNTDNSTDVIDTSDAENNNSQENNEEDVIQQAENTQLQPDCELDGSIESIGENSVVINQTFHPSENESVAYIDSRETLVTVYFSEETAFEVWTVKNGGVNGDADIEKRQGAFSDLKLDASLKMTGSYEGDDFHAERVIIYKSV